jgi:hypothetical protein
MAFGEETMSVLQGKSLMLLKGQKHALSDQSVTCLVASLPRSTTNLGALTQGREFGRCLHRIIRRHTIAEVWFLHHGRHTLCVRMRNRFGCLVDQHSTWTISIKEKRLMTCGFLTQGKCSSNGVESKVTGRFLWKQTEMRILLIEVLGVFENL